MVNKNVLPAGMAILMALAACSDQASHEGKAQGSNADDVASLAPASVQEKAQPAPTETVTQTPVPQKQPAEIPSAQKPETDSAKPTSAPAKESTAVETAAAQPPAVFARCAVCHDAEKGGPNKLGPNLFGVVGSKAAFHPGFSYSDALKSSGLVWTDANLDAWIENPRTLVPGSRMAFPGLKDPAKRQEIIEYLKTRK